MGHIAWERLRGDDVCKGFIIVAVTDKLFCGEMQEFKVVGLKWCRVIEMRHQLVCKGDGVAASTVPVAATQRCWCRGKEVKEGLIWSLIVTVRFGWLSS